MSDRIITEIDRHGILGPEQLAVRELIERRVREEVRHRQTLAPISTTRFVLSAIDDDGYPRFSTEKKRRVNVERAVTAAQTAFREGRFWIVLDGRRLNDLDEVIELRIQSDLIFIPRAELKGL